MHQPVKPKHLDAPSENWLSTVSTCNDLPKKCGDCTQVVQQDESAASQNMLVANIATGSVGLPRLRTSSVLRLTLPCERIFVTQKPNTINFSRKEPIGTRPESLLEPARRR